MEEQINQNRDQQVFFLMFQKCMSSNVNDVIRAALNPLFIFYFFYEKILHAPKAPKPAKPPKAQKRKKSNK